MRYLGGHLGIAVTALLDGQLDQASAERAWHHVHTCAACRRQVEMEGWVKTRLASMSAEEDRPPEELLGSLYDLDGAPAASGGASPAAAWAAVGELERRARSRRRTGLALAGAGSVSAAVLGLATLTGSQLGIGGAGGTAPTSPPASLSTRATPVGESRPAVVAPIARVHGSFVLPERRRDRGDGTADRSGRNRDQNPGHRRESLSP